MLFARWALSASALSVIGAFGATLLNYPADPRVMRIARRAAIAMILSCVLVITAQLYDWFGMEGLTDPENVWTMLSITLWGLHWAWLAAVAILALGLSWHVPAQSPEYLVAYGASHGRLYSHGQARRMAFAYEAIALAGLALCLPYWHLLGLI
jgi:hypothetical protein